MQRFFTTLSSPFSGHNQRGRSREPIIVSSLAANYASRSSRNAVPSDLRHMYRASGDRTQFSSKPFDPSSRHPEASRRTQPEHGRRQSYHRHRYHRSRSSSSDRSSERSRSSSRDSPPRHYRHSTTSRGYHSRPHTPPRDRGVNARSRDKSANVRRAASLPRQARPDEGYRSSSRDHHKVCLAPSIHTQSSFWASDAAPSRNSTVVAPPDRHYVHPTGPPRFYGSNVVELESSPHRTRLSPSYPPAHYHPGHGPGLRHSHRPSGPPLPPYPGSFPLHPNDHYSSGPRSRFLSPSHSRPRPYGPGPSPPPTGMPWGTPYASSGSSTAVGPDPGYNQFRDFNYNTLNAGHTPLASAVILPRERKSKKLWKVY